MGRVQLDIRVAEEFLQEIRNYKNTSAEQIKTLEASIRSIENVWEDDQGKEFSDKLISKLRILEEFSNGLNTIERFVEAKIAAASKRLV